MTEKYPQCVVLPGLSPPSPRYPRPVSFPSFCPEDNPDRDLLLVVLGTEPGMPGQMPLLVWAGNVGWGLNSAAFLPVFYRDFFFLLLQILLFMNWPSQSSPTKEVYCRLICNSWECKNKIKNLAWSIMKGKRVEWSGFSSWPWYSLARWPWMRHLSSLCFFFF